MPAASPPPRGRSEAIEVEGWNRFFSGPIAGRGFRRQSFVRSMRECDIEEAGEAAGRQVHAFNVKGRAFLWHQVRCIWCRPFRHRFPHHIIKSFRITIFPKKS